MLSGGRLLPIKKEVNHESETLYRIHPHRRPGLDLERGRDGRTFDNPGPGGAGLPRVLACRATSTRDENQPPAGLVLSEAKDRSPAGGFDHV